MTDLQVQREVADELFWDPKITRPGDIAVVSKDGAVTLRGTVGTFQERCDAADDASRIRGVTGVTNELAVSPLEGTARNDADLRGAVLQALMLDSRVPSTVDAVVVDGQVTLTGSATWGYQRTEAQNVAGRIGGVTGVVDQIDLVPGGPAANDDVRKAIASALQRHARVTADGIAVRSQDGLVVLSGTVATWAEHNDAEAAAWSAPGVTNVVNDLHVQS